MNLTRLRIFIAERSEGSPIGATLVALAKDSMVYLVGAALIGLGNFVLVPLYTRYLTPAEFGMYALVDISILIIVTVTQLGFGVSYLKWFADAGPLRRSELLGSTLIVGALAASIGGGLSALTVASPIGEQWLQTADRDFAWMLLPIVILENVQGLLLTDLRARRRTIAFSTSAAARLLTIVGASLWFIAIQGQGVNGVFLGRLFGDGVAVVLLAVFCLRSIALRFAWSIVAPMMRYGLPLVWSGLIWMMLDASGRYFLRQFSTFEQVGLYGAAIKISNIFQMSITQPFSVAWGGLMFQIVKWPSARLVYSKIVSVILIISVVIALVMALFGPTLFALFTTPAYFAAATIFPILLLIRVIQTMNYPVSAGVYLGGRTYIMAVIWSIGLGLNIAANILLVPKYGMLGASVAWLTGEIVIIALLGSVGQLYYRISYEWRSFTLALGLLVLFWELKEILYENFILRITGSLALSIIGAAFIYINLHKLRRTQDE